MDGWMDGWMDVDRWIDGDGLSSPVLGSLKGEIYNPRDR